MYDDAVLLTPAQVDAAASRQQLGRLAERLVAERSWPSLGLLFSHAGGPTVPLDELVAAARATNEALTGLPEARSGRATIYRELRGLRSIAASTIARRVPHEPLTHDERTALTVAAEIYLKAGEPREAAGLYERVGDDGKAADTWETVGDLERLEACLDRIEAKRGAQLHTAQTVRQFETLVAAGERSAALEGLQRLGSDADRSSLGPLAAELGRRLRRGRSVALRDDHAAVRRLAGASVTLGRDPNVELPLRDPGVSRQHAILTWHAGRVHLDDSGSRAGTWISNARVVGRLPIDGDGEMRLGDRARLRYRALGSGVTELRGTTGLDRDVHALVAEAEVPLELAFPGARGLVMRFGGPVPRLVRVADVTVKVAGHLVGHSCDLLQDDVIELAGCRLVVL